MTPTVEWDGFVVKVSEFATLPPDWKLGRIYNGNALGRSQLLVTILNILPSDRADRAKVQHYEDEIFFEL